MAINQVNVSWTNAGNNQTASIYAAKLDWTAAETRNFNTAINFGSALGKTLGALYGSRVISKLGRRKTYIYFNILVIFACLFTQVLTVWTLALGKFLRGLFVTTVHLSVIKHINETVPADRLSKVGIMIQLMANFGLLLCMGLGQIFPESDYNPELVDNEKNLKAK